MGERLVIVLTDTGMVEARLWPLRLTGHKGDVAQIELGWSPIPLYSFDATKAEQLLVLYLTALTQRWYIGEADVAPDTPSKDDPAPKLQIERQPS